MRRLQVLEVLLLGTACSESRAPKGAVADQYAVYSAVLDTFFVQPGRPLRVRSSTNPYNPAAALGDSSMIWQAVRDSSSVPANLWRAFARANAETRPLCACFHSSVPVALVDSTVEPTPMTPPPGWPEVSEKYHAGPVALSGIGFDASSGQAVVFAGQSCGWLCAKTVFVLLEKRANRWVILRTLFTGVS